MASAEEVAKAFAKTRGDDERDPLDELVEYIRREAELIAGEVDSLEPQTERIAGIADAATKLQRIVDEYLPDE